MPNLTSWTITPNFWFTNEQGTLISHINEELAETESIKFVPSTQETYKVLESNDSGTFTIEVSMPETRFSFIELQAFNNFIEEENIVDKVFWWARRNSEDNHYIVPESTFIRNIVSDEISIEEVWDTDDLLIYEGAVIATHSHGSPTVTSTWKEYIVWWETTDKNIYPVVYNTKLTTPINCYPYTSAYDIYSARTKEKHKVSIHLGQIINFLTQRRRQNMWQIQRTLAAETVTVAGSRVRLEHTLIKRVLNDGWMQTICWPRDEIFPVEDMGISDQEASTTVRINMWDMQATTRFGTSISVGTGEYYQIQDTDGTEEFLRQYIPQYDAYIASKKAEAKYAIWDVILLTPNNTQWNKFVRINREYVILWTANSPSWEVVYRVVAANKKTINTTDSSMNILESDVIPTWKVTKRKFVLKEDFGKYKAWHTFTRDEMIQVLWKFQDARTPFILNQLYICAE